MREPSAFTVPPPGGRSGPLGRARTQAPAGFQFAPFGSMLGSRIETPMNDTPARWDGPDLVLTLHAQPGARKTLVTGLHGGALKLKLAARPVEGAANAALLEFVAGSFGVPKRQVLLESGDTSRHKRVRVQAPPRVAAEQVLQAWGVAGGAGAPS